MAPGGTPPLLAGANRASAVLAAAMSMLATRAAALAAADILFTKVWLDEHLFNMTLKTTRTAAGKVFLMSEGKALEKGLPWPPWSWPTLCFLGLGPQSIEYLVALAQLFPELQLVLMDVDDSEWLKSLDESLGESSGGRIELGQVDDFAEAHGPNRRTCHAISWSVDTPPFSFYRYRELFYSSPYILTLFNMQGCSPDTRNDQADSYYCEYLYSSFQYTLCGKINDDRAAEYGNESVYFPLVDSKCGENLCMCYAHSDAFLDFHFEHMCKVNQKHRFMAQWGQDKFLIDNIFRHDLEYGQGVYVDIGASHPYHLSNTAYFDNCLGWRGVCIEPNPRSRPILRALRTCHVISACAWANSTTMRFANGAELAARTEDDSLLPSDPYSIPANGSMDDTYFEARCSNLHDLLSEGVSAIGGRRPRVDVLSVDAEGAEIEIFKDFPFDEWDIRVVVVETSRRTSMAIDGLFLLNGFLKIAVLGKDAVYLSRAMASVLPPNGLVFPKRIAWNEPGTDADTIDFFRFQRYFGVEGDLDDDVGDQRLENETELARQADRMSAQHAESVKKLVAEAKGATLGGIFSESQRSALEKPEVQETMRDPRVKAALTLMLTDEDAFARQMIDDPTLKARISELIDLGIIRPNAAIGMAAA